MDAKKTEELVILELFRDRYKDFPKGILIASESPDFILNLGPRKRIGLELMRLHQQAVGPDPFTFENIAACLRQKEEKLALYRKKKLQEYWLILSVRDPAFRPRYNLNNKLMVWRFPSSYNRIFIFDVMDGKVLELKKDN